MPAPRALIADDEPLLAADLATRLQRLWPALDIVAVVHHGPAAVEALRHFQPDIAFLDIRMPGLSGLEVAQAAGHSRVVFVTAFEQFAVAAFEQAAVDYLLKPVSDERLAQSIARLQRQTRPTPGLEPLLQQLPERQTPASRRCA